MRGSTTNQINRNRTRSSRRSMLRILPVNPGKVQRKQRHPTIHVRSEKLPRFIGAPGGAQGRIFPLTSKLR
jgi:hypothetical protein